MDAPIFHGHPVGGVDYPRTIVEFDRWFPDEEACISYLMRLRWPTGFVCPSCNGRKGWLTSRGQIRCAICQRQTSVTAGSIFDKTRKPLRTWFLAIWHITNQKYGGNALGLKRTLGLGSYQTAWSWLHKMRRAMVTPGRHLLNGHVEVDETYIGGEEGGHPGRKVEKKAIVVVGIEVFEPKGFGRVRLQQIPDVSRNSLVGFICREVKPGSGDPAHVVLPGVHRISSLLKRWLLGTHQGAVSKKHLNYYLDEYAFRFNRRTSKARGLLFYRLLQNAAQIGPSTYADLSAGEQDRGRKSKSRNES